VRRYGEKRLVQFCGKKPNGSGKITLSNARSWSTNLNKEKKKKIQKERKNLPHSIIHDLEGGKKGETARAQGGSLL